VNLVIDASVLVKLFIPEILSEKAQELSNRVTKWITIIHLEIFK
jgi:predicted nucleic acid-binding protein